MNMLHIFGIILTITSYIVAEDYEGNNEFSNSTIHKAYQTGVELGIIDIEKYPFQTFQSDERNIFRDVFREYTSLNGSEPINYQEWLIMNNFGILVDTQESLFARKIAKRSTADNKRRFVNTVRKGDILITGRGIGGLIGHAAIMTTNYWVLEMPGGRGWNTGLKNNNRQISKHAWFDQHRSDWTTVYRNRDRAVAQQAAVWADHNYYNPRRGAKKTIHVTYRITTDIRSKNPSYCSKLVIQAYYFGTKKKVIRGLDISGRIIIPTNIPIYFKHPFTLVNKGKY